MAQSLKSVNVITLFVADQRAGTLAGFRFGTSFHLAMFV